MFALYFCSTRRQCKLCESAITQGIYGLLISFSSVVDESNPLKRKYLKSKGWTISFLYVIQFSLIITRFQNYVKKSGVFLWCYSSLNTPKSKSFSLYIILLPLWSCRGKTLMWETKAERILPIRMEGTSWITDSSAPLSQATTSITHHTSSCN